MTPIEEHELEDISGGTQQELIDFLERVFRDFQHMMYQGPMPGTF